MRASTVALPLAALAGLSVWAACLSVDLEGRPCPCLDGFVCVDDVCVRPGPDAGPADDGPADGGARDAGAAQDAGNGDPQDAGVAGCPDSFTTSCSGDLPLHAALARVCDDGDTFPVDLVEELGAGGGTCVGPPDTATIASSTLAGTLDSAGGGASLSLTGEVTYDVTVPDQCVPGGICLDSGGSGTCGSEGDACVCTGVVVDGATNDTLNAIGGGELAGAHRYIGCRRSDGSYLLRESEVGRLGPILVFGN